MNRVRPPIAPPSRSTASRWPASQYSSNPEQSCPPSAAPKLGSFSLQVHGGVNLIRAAKCISKSGRSGPPITSLSLLSFGLQVHPQTRSITAFNFISAYTRSWPPSASPNSLDYCIEVHLDVSHNLSMVKWQRSLGIWEESVRKSGSGWSIWREHDRICRGSWPWWTTKIAWMYKSLARVGGSKCWERWTVCISYNEMMCIYSPVSPYTPPTHVAQSITVFPVLQFTRCRLPPAKLNGGGGEKPIFSPQWPPSASLNSLNRGLNVLIWLPSKNCLSPDWQYVYI